MPLPANATYVRIALGLAVAASLCWASPASAQVESREGIALQNQILELRSELQGLRGQIAAGTTGYAGAPAGGYAQPQGDLMARLLTRVSALEDQVRALTGRVDELANEVRRQGEVLNKQIGDLGFRVQTLEGAGGRPAPGRHAGATRSEPPRAQPQQPAEPEEAEAAPAAPDYRSPAPGSLGALPLMPPPDQGGGYGQPAPYMSGPPSYAPEYAQPGRPPAYAPQSAGGALPLMPPAEPVEPPRSRQTRTAAAGGALSLAPPAVMPEAAAAQSQPNTAESMIRGVRSALGRRDYSAAESGARALLNAGAQRHAAEAHYLLARAQAGQKSYAQAAVAFDEAYKTAPSGPFAEASLFGMASSLASIGAKPAACAALDKLKTEFLTQRATIREAATTLRKREGCNS